MDEYLENLGTFYDEKVKFLSQKDKFISCNHCSDKKEFKETFEEVSISCGGNNNTSCGTQIIIKFPKYLHYEKTIESLKEKLDENLNWNVIQNYINIDDIKSKKELMNKIKEEIHKIEELFIQENIKSKEKLIQEFYNQRIKKTKRCNIILNELKKPLDTDVKKELHNEYINNIIELNKEYSEIKTFIETINPYLLVEEPEIKIKNDKHVIQNNKKVSPPFTKGDNVSWIIKDKKETGEIQEIKGKKAIILNQDDKKVLIPIAKLEKIIIDKLELDDDDDEL